MSDFKRLKVWQRAHTVALSSYRLTRGFPRSEVFGLALQIRRAAASVSANIAESCGRRANRDQGRFLQIALGSAKEFESHLLLAHDLGFLSPDEFAETAALLDEVQRMHPALIRTTLRAQSPARSFPTVSRLPSTGFSP
jgi:four helix bundle protein